MLSIFTTDDPIEAKRITKALDMASCLWDIHNLRRKLIKYAPTGTSDHDIDLMEKIFEEIYVIYEDHDINIEELIE